MKHDKMRFHTLLFLSSILLAFFLSRIIVVHMNPVTIVKVDPQTSYANVGETFDINITVVDVQNLYSVEVSLRWNASILRVINVDLRLGVESHLDGVLHELPSAPIYVVENSTFQELGQYRLAAMSTAPALSFNGSGNIVRITFNATNYGESKLDLETQLYDRPPPDDVSMPIDHATIDGFSEVIIPEFSDATILVLLIILTTLTTAFSKRYNLKKHSQHSQSCFEDSN